MVWDRRFQKYDDLLQEDPPKKDLIKKVVEESEPAPSLLPNGFVELAPIVDEAPKPKRKPPARSKKTLDVIVEPEQSVIETNQPPSVDEDPKKEDETPKVVVQNEPN